MIVKAARCWEAVPDDVLSLQLGQLRAGFHHVTSLFLEHIADKVQIMSQCEGSPYMYIRHLVTSLFLEHFADKVQIMSQCESCQYRCIRWMACEARESRASTVTDVDTVTNDSQRSTVLGGSTGPCDELPAGSTPCRLTTCDEPLSGSQS